MAGAVGWTYAATLGLALVYLGEHYAIDLIAGATLAEAVRTSAPGSRRLSGACHRCCKRSRRERLTHSAARG